MRERIISRIHVPDERPHSQRQRNHRYLFENVSEAKTRESDSPYGIGAILFTISHCIGKEAEWYHIPFIEMLPAANLLRSGDTVGSFTLFIFAFCRTFATME